MTRLTRHSTKRRSGTLQRKEQWKKTRFGVDNNGGESTARKIDYNPNLEPLPLMLKGPKGTERQKAGQIRKLVIRYQKPCGV
jgi:hypothetical protein